MRSTITFAAQHSKPIVATAALFKNHVFSANSSKATAFAQPRVSSISFVPVASFSCTPSYLNSGSLPTSPADILVNMQDVKAKETSDPELFKSVSHLFTQQDVCDNARSHTSTLYPFLNREHSIADVTALILHDWYLLKVPGSPGKLRSARQQLHSLTADIMFGSGKSAFLDEFQPKLCRSIIFAKELGYEKFLKLAAKLRESSTEYFAVPAGDTLYHASIFDLSQKGAKLLEQCFSIWPSIPANAKKELDAAQAEAESMLDSAAKQALREYEEQSCVALIVQLFNKLASSKNDWHAYLPNALWQLAFKCEVIPFESGSVFLDKAKDLGDKLEKRQVSSDTVVLVTVDEVGSEEDFRLIRKKLDGIRAQEARFGRAMHFVMAGRDYFRASVGIGESSDIPHWVAFGPLRDLDIRVLLFGNPEFRKALELLFVEAPESGPDSREQLEAHFFDCAQRASGGNPRVIAFQMGVAIEASRHIFGLKETPLMLKTKKDIDFFVYDVCYKMFCTQKEAKDIQAFVAKRNRGTKAAHFEAFKSLIARGDFSITNMHDSIGVNVNGKVKMVQLFDLLPQLPVQVLTDPSKPQQAHLSPSYFIYRLLKEAGALTPLDIDLISLCRTLLKQSENRVQTGSSQLGFAISESQFYEWSTMMTVANYLPDTSPDVSLPKQLHLDAIGATLPSIATARVILNGRVLLPAAPQVKPGKASIFTQKVQMDTADDVTREFQTIKTATPSDAVHLMDGCVDFVKSTGIPVAGLYQHMSHSADWFAAMLAEVNLTREQFVLQLYGQNRALHSSATSLADIGLESAKMCGSSSASSPRVFMFFTTNMDASLKTLMGNKKFLVWEAGDKLYYTEKKTKYVFEFEVPHNAEVIVLSEAMQQAFFSPHVTDLLRRLQVQKQHLSTS